MGISHRLKEAVDSFLQPSNSTGRKVQKQAEENKTGEKMIVSGKRMDDFCNLSGSGTSIRHLHFSPHFVLFLSISLFPSLPLLLLLLSKAGDGDSNAPLHIHTGKLPGAFGTVLNTNYWGKKGDRFLFNSTSQNQTSNLSVRSPPPVAPPLTPSHSCCSLEWVSTDMAQASFCPEQQINQKTQKRQCSESTGF